ncbi:hypothetical protein E2562_029230 [Oryza meyeriana var. granulata]|uniref:Uncharacterized protein n=1 Tax=Oryza meyeriana var. granulata TaxID=110450 RepID=A0A6G1EQU7_9ORYZ|nr:hypothetical protein E2562_029230 [Oryza meyeriana var. granulata]
MVPDAIRALGAAAAARVLGWDKARVVEAAMSLAMGTALLLLVVGPRGRRRVVVGADLARDATRWSRILRLRCAEAWGPAPAASLGSRARQRRSAAFRTV